MGIFKTFLILKQTSFVGGPGESLWVGARCMQTGSDTRARLYCPSRSPFQLGCPGHCLLPGLGQRKDLLCPYLSPDPLPVPHKCMREVSMRTYSRSSKQIIFSHLLQSPVRADYGYSLSVLLLLIKSPNFAIDKLRAAWLP